jgi:hypothetical protein
MIEFVDTSPDINAQPAEFQRLLGYPPNHVVEGRGRDLMDWAGDWFARNGRPWVYSRQANRLEIDDGTVSIDGVQFSSNRLETTLKEARADQVILVAASAGEQLEQAAQELWREGKPDEYFFLEVYGSAIVEHLITMHGAHLCAWAESQQLAVLPHYSPGYTDWDIAQQPRLLELISQTREHSFPAKLETLTSGMLRPKKSLLAVFGLTRHTANVLRLSDLSPCQSCSFLPCQYRRAPYRRASEYAENVVSQMGASNAVPVASFSADGPLDRNARYAVNAKALKRWSAERLKLNPAPDGSIEANFHYEGTTCSNMGRRLSFQYEVKLGPRDEGYPIRDERCSPAADDDGHPFMCRFLDDGRGLKAVLDAEKPLLGRPLNDVLSWQDSSAAAGCYCESIDRLHKWRLALETIHYALVQRENGDTTVSGVTELRP